MIWKIDGKYGSGETSICGSPPHRIRGRFSWQNLFSFKNEEKREWIHFCLDSSFFRSGSKGIFGLLVVRGSGEEGLEDS